MLHLPKRIAIACLIVGQLWALLYTNAVYARTTPLDKIAIDPREQEHVINAARRSTVVLNNQCSSARFTIMNKFTVYKPVSLDDSGAIVAGAWKQVVSEEGCDDTRTLNVLVSVDPSSHSLRFTPMLPGTTHADIVLQKDAVHYAVIAAGGPKTNCKIGYVEDTEFLHTVAEPIEGATSPAWDELWTLAPCTKQIRVTMHFIPDRTGTTIAATLRRNTNNEVEP
jgi:hypothetical protein